LTSEQTLPFFSLSEILNATGGRLIRGSTTGDFHGISTDSRQIGQGCLFIPLRGEKYDGHDFLTAAVRQGAAGVLLQKDFQTRLPVWGEAVSVILVEDTLTALGDIAHARRKKIKARVLAITGSSGKTTTKEMVAGIAELAFNVAKTQGNFNNLVGVPMTLLNLRARYDVLILELGTNRRGEIERLTRIAEPDIGLITNIGPAHLAGLKSLDIVREEKCDLIRNMSSSGIAVINGDDEALKTFGSLHDGRKITFGFSPDVDVAAENIVGLGRHGIKFILRLRERRQEINLSATGEHNIYNALAAAASSWALGIEQTVISQGLTAFKPVSGRMEILPLKNGAFIINDTYNANPASVREALKTLNFLRENHHSTVIMGDMLELGDHADQMHEDIGRLMADTGVGTIFLRGRLSQATAAGATKRHMPQERIFHFETKEEVIKPLKQILKKGDWILVKGSRLMMMEEIVRAIVDEFGADDNQGAKENR